MEQPDTSICAGCGKPFEIYAPGFGDELGVWVPLEGGIHAAVWHGKCLRERLERVSLLETALVESIVREMKARKR
jgi:hypothetical protein